MTRKLLLVASIAALAVAVAGCGGSDETSETTEATPAAEWADGFCGAITAWTDSLTSVKDQFTDLSSFSEEGLRSAADDMRSATDALVDDIQGLGAPDTESGQEIKASLDELATTLESEAEAISTTVEETSGITEIPGAAKDVLESLETMGTAFESTLSTIEDADVQGELEDALESSSACDDITS
jgi:hypothetical protein